MKREHPDAAGCDIGDYSKMDGVPQKGKIPVESLPDPGGMDELLAALGYKVKTSNMADIAQKLEQLETMMGSGQEDGLITHLASETVHYNPSDLANWLENMLAELQPSPQFHSGCSMIEAPSPLPLADVESSNIGSVNIHQTRFSDTDNDLRAIPGEIICGGERDSIDRDTKRMKPGALTTRTNADESACSVVLVDTQETGIRLVHTLMACAEAVQQSNLRLADTLVKEISMLAASQVGAMRKVATYFAEALARRVYHLYPPNDPLDSLSEMLEMHFYESCPYLKFAHFTANQAILEAFGDRTCVHVIDLSMKQGMQWPPLMQALALRPGGPPFFRLTAIGPPQPDNPDALQQVGLKLAQFADTVNVKFEYRPLVANNLDDIEPYMLDVRPDVELVAVNSVFELHRLLARPRAMEKMLATVKEVGPKIVTIVEQEANHNGPVFLDRFTEALHYYSTVFDSLEGCVMPSASSQDHVMSEVYLGRQICNVVACEGQDRVERHEPLSQWRTRMMAAGFASAHLGSNAFKRASMLLAFSGLDGYRVEENAGCLTLGWHTRPLIASSAWYIPWSQSNKQP